MNNSKTNTLLWGLTALSSVLLSLPFLVPHAGFVALFALVPLLMMERIASLSGTRHVWVFHYSCFVLWNALTTFWVCNATVGGGLFAIFANAFQMSLVFGIFRFSKKYSDGVLPYIFLAAAWIAWERMYFDVDISWPWLVLGNAFAGSIRSVQWYEFTGTLGGSLWIWMANLSLFGILVSLSDGSWASRFNLKAKIASVAGYVILIAAPFIVSSIIFSKYEEKEDPVEIAIVQPNIDPYRKFEAMSRQEQDELYLGMASSALKDRALPSSDGAPLLLMAPETFTSNVMTNDISSGWTWRRFVSFLRDYPGVNLLYGASTYDLIQSPEAPSHTARPLRDNRWIESHNSALLVDGTGRTEIFHKNKLVVAVEKTPYPAFFCKIDDLLGGVMGRCVGQGDVSLLHCTGTEGTSIPFGCAVCYESVYGEYYTGYVKKGAEFMTIITNDAWWGNTPGYRQHLRYASLRAIETRRSIARCANTGISAFISQKGEIVSSSEWWKPQTMRGFVNRNSEETFFVKSGDIVGRLCVFLFWLFSAAILVKALTSLTSRKR